MARICAMRCTMLSQPCAMAEERDRQRRGEEKKSNKHRAHWANVVWPWRASFKKVFLHGWRKQRMRKGMRKKRNDQKERGTGTSTRTAAHTSKPKRWFMVFKLNSFAYNKFSETSVHRGTISRNIVFCFHGRKADFCWALHPIVLCICPRYRIHFVDTNTNDILAMAPYRISFTYNT